VVDALVPVFRTTLRCLYSGVCDVLRGGRSCREDGLVELLDSVLLLADEIGFNADRLLGLHAFSGRYSPAHCPLDTLFRRLQNCLRRIALVFHCHALVLCQLASCFQLWILTL
jgi:hypothetical protein